MRLLGGWTLQVPIFARVGLLCVLIVGSVLLAQLDGRLRAQAASPFPVEPPPRFVSFAVDADGEALSSIPTLAAPIEKTIRRGQTLKGVFLELGLDEVESSAATRAALVYLNPRALRAGSSITAYLLPSAQISRVVFHPDELTEVRIERTDEGWSSGQERHEVVRREAIVEGWLEGALESSIRTAGAPGQLAYRLADVFQWDLDFSRDLRVGDRYSVVYEEVWIAGSRSRVGEIAAAVYENRGSMLEAYRFRDAYYDGKGRALRKQFLRSPLTYSRVTSRFSHRRFHPILKVYRPHLGVDYGAPTGTPVRVTANGVVRSAAWSKGGGNTVQVRHPNGYTTAYLHLSRFAEGVRSGKRVRQGDVVGFVGATGLATAPHLDYRVGQNGRWINPLSLPNEPAPSLTEDELIEFEAHRDQLRAKLRDLSMRVDTRAAGA